MPVEQSLILVGASMGAWIAFHVAMKRPTRIAGVVGVATAVDFTEDWSKEFSLSDTEQLQEKGFVLRPSKYSINEPYPITRSLLQDAKDNWLISLSTTRLTIPIRLIHGLKDLDVPWEKVVRLVDLIEGDDVALTLIKEGDHRLSSLNDLVHIIGVIKHLKHQIDDSFGDSETHE